MKSLQASQSYNWTPFVNAPFFPSHATIDDPVVAYKKVLSNVGANQPVMDENDSRMIRETLTRSWTYRGSRSDILGEIDHEDDCGGFELYPEETRPADYDTDKDGVPNWFEKLVGTNPDVEDNNADSNQDGYTHLEDYLHWMAEEHRIVPADSVVTINFPTLFAGFTKSPAFSYSCDDEGLTISFFDSQTLRISATITSPALHSIRLEVTDAEGATMQRMLNIAFTDETSAISETTYEQDFLLSAYAIYTLEGKLIYKEHIECNDKALRRADFKMLDKGRVYILRATDKTGHTSSYRIIR